ncbi:MAG: hypothetical protein KME13_00815 [Myxacorys californica WJT36-NPBG1]|nr:hypothetical protein [Myxacorys californica WJT36-NPBG1]
MGLQGFAKFHELLKHNHHPAMMGFGTKICAGDINRFASRIKLAKNFRSINLDEYSPLTVLGYDAFFQVFLTHSALERFLEISAVQLDELEALMMPYKPEEVIQKFVEEDKKKLLFDFLHERLNFRLRNKLSDCRDLSSCNVAYISASIRHIFAHGHLCAHSKRMQPKNVHIICTAVSDFLLNFMEAEFAKKIENYLEVLSNNQTDKAM